ncbi:MAG: pyridoxamine 5'-phosphate oxidase family protein [Pseudomonadota bacterium]
MATLAEIAPDFVTMAHKIVWCAVATVDAQQRPWTRVLHPIWEYDGAELSGYIATGPTPIKTAHLAHSAYLSCNYWTPEHDTCSAECHAQWLTGAEEKQTVWDKLANAPEPVGYNPSMIDGWDDAQSPTFAALKLTPWRVRVMPAAAMLTGEGTQIWQA